MPVDCKNSFPCIVPAGDSAALIRFAGELDFNVNAAVLEFDNHLAGSSIDGVTEVSPALVSLLVRFDPLQVAYSDIAQHSPPVLVKHGDTVEYHPVSAREFEKLHQLAGNGESVIERVA